jgi:hypothetical protein
MILSIDDNSNCAVLTWYSLSTPFLLSHLMDNIIRNQVYTLAEHDGKYEWINMYQYIGEQYGLSKKGSPKIFVTIPESRECLTNSQKASILASETIYPDNENMGSIIDSTITSLIDKNQGMGQGQYDRATVYAYSNVLLQFTPSFKKSVSDRLWEEAVTQFYIESTLFEETAIEIADSDITEALESVSGSDRYEAIADLTAFLSHVSVIYDNYSRTIDFWDRQVKYPSSQESLDMIRKAFKIDQKLAYLRRDQEQLQTVFRTKSNAIDREDSKREGNALALLAILAVFSAWCDSFSFVDNFKTMFSDKWGLYIPQIIIFIIVLILAFIAIWQLFSISDFIRKLKDKRKDRQ